MNKSTYLVFPRKNPLNGSLSLASRKTDRVNRSKQLDEAKSARFASKDNQDFLSWMRGSKFSDQSSASLSETGGVTGIRVLEMSDQDADIAAKELKEFVVLRDQPLELIKPLLMTGAKASLGDGDSWHLESIGLEIARQRGYRATGNGITVAVLDTGVEESHPELIGKVTRTLTFDTQNRLASEMHGPSTDTSGHGTHVSGLICGNSVGVAPNARVSNYRMIPFGQGQLSDFVLAIETAAADPDIQVVNISAGLRGYYPEFRAALDSLRYAGVFTVVATGNEGEDQTRSPGNFNEVLSVGAIDRNQQMAVFSSSGQMIFDHQSYTVPDLVAPGVGVYSSVMTGGYEAWDGTSMATPIVSGIAALILEMDTSVGVLELEQEIKSACIDLGLSPSRQGKGLVQVTRTPAISTNDGVGGGAPAGV